ncbi:hypothetical protein GCM10010195_60930 [Kitasatospora griseola]|nr:hypothetical protein GCM10010195_60930 [Kitasatospora griseola]
MAADDPVGEQASGRPRATEGALTCPLALALASINALRFDTAVLSCCALSAADGLTAYDLDDATVKKAAMAAARRTLVAASAGKLGRTAFARVAPPRACTSSSPTPTPPPPHPSSR